ncbi:MAG: SH3 domain-containing protein, partial [Burkholderiales bacterium]
VFVKKGEPVEVNAEFEQWRKIKDKQGDEGWMHESMLSGQRYIIVEGNAEQALVMYRKPDLLSKPVAMLTPEVRAELKECQSDWCRIETHNVTGWIEKQHIWGVYKHEIFD